MSESEFWIRFWSVVGLTVVLIAATVTTGVVLTTRMFVTHGYVETTLPGRNTKAWTLPVCDSRGLTAARH